MIFQFIGQQNWQTLSSSAVYRSFCSTTHVCFRHNSDQRFHALTVSVLTILSARLFQFNKYWLKQFWSIVNWKSFVKNCCETAFKFSVCFKINWSCKLFNILFQFFFDFCCKTERLWKSNFNQRFCCFCHHQIFLNIFQNFIIHNRPFDHIQQTEMLLLYSLFSLIFCFEYRFHILSWSLFLDLKTQDQVFPYIFCWTDHFFEFSVLDISAYIPSVQRIFAFTFFVIISSIVFESALSVKFSTLIAFSMSASSWSCHHMPNINAERSFVTSFQRRIISCWTKLRSMSINLIMKSFLVSVNIWRNNIHKLKSQIVSSKQFFVQCFCDLDCNWCKCASCKYFCSKDFTFNASPPSQSQMIAFGTPKNHDFVTIETSAFNEVHFLFVKDWSVYISINLSTLQLCVRYQLHDIFALVLKSVQPFVCLCLFPILHWHLHCWKSIFDFVCLLDSLRRLLLRCLNVWNRVHMVSLDWNLQLI